VRHRAKVYGGSEPEGRRKDGWLPFCAPGKKMGGALHEEKAHDVEAWAFHFSAVEGVSRVNRVPEFDRPVQ